MNKGSKCNQHKNCQYLVEHSRSRLWILYKNIENHKWEIAKSIYDQFLGCSWIRPIPSGSGNQCVDSNLKTFTTFALCFFREFVLLVQ